MGCGRSEPPPAARVSLLHGRAGGAGAAGSKAAAPRLSARSRLCVRVWAHETAWGSLSRPSSLFRPAPTSLRLGPRRPEERLDRLFKSRRGPFPLSLRKWRESPTPAGPHPGQVCPGRTAKQLDRAVNGQARGAALEGGKGPRRLWPGNPERQGEAGRWTVESGLPTAGLTSSAPTYSGLRDPRRGDRVDETLPKGQAALAHGICVTSANRLSGPRLPGLYNGNGTWAPHLSAQQTAPRPPCSGGKCAQKSSNGAVIRFHVGQTQLHRFSLLPPIKYSEASGTGPVQGGSCSDEGSRLGLEKPIKEPFPLAGKWAPGSCRKPGCPGPFCLSGPRLSR